MMPSPQPATYDLPSGTMLGKYEIIRKLAMGGMAEIYLARVRGTAGFEKLVVIKRILPNVAVDPNFVRMFLDEARLAATLQHPNIADVHEVGEASGAPFFAMEFIHGQDVRAIRAGVRKRREALPLAVALAIIHATASALDHAHDRRGPDGKLLGVVHRDVSPSNILVSYEGAIKLIDFGIARASDRTHQTQAGGLKGKIPYMSPEQCRGTGVDHRSDLFSLGIVMYELTVGRRPFRGETDFAIMDQIVNGAPEAPSSALPGYPPELEAIVLKLLAHKREDRYQSAEALLHDLDPFIANHRLWLGAKQLSRFMRSVFAEQLAAWDAAAADAGSLAQHLASTITSQSASSELVTPPSAFPSLVPVSQQFPTPALPPELAADDDDASATRRSPLPVAMAAPAPITGTSMPSLRPQRRWGVIAIAFLAVLGGGLAIVMMQSGGRPGDKASPAVAPASAEPAPPAAAAPIPPPTETAATTDTKPATTDTKPAATPDTKPAATTDVTPTLPPVDKPAKRPTPPATTRPKPTPKKPDKPADKKPEEQTWDPNSPFLPPSR